MALAVTAEEITYVYCLVLLLCMIACSVYLFVKSGMVQGSYEKLLQEGEYTVEKKMNKRISFFVTAYWCITTAIYLGISFYNAWDRSWIIWPVAGVFFVGIQGILFGILYAKQRKAER